MTVYVRPNSGWVDFPATSTGTVNASWLSQVDDALTGATGLALNGGAFTNSYDTSLWIVPATRNNPVNNFQGMYIQTRVTGDLGGFVHDAGASELRMSGASNGGTAQNAFEASLVVTGGTNSVASANGIAINFHTENSPAGSFTSVALLRAQAIAALTGTFTLTTAYGLYVERQTVATTNYSVYAPDGDSVFGPIRPKDTSTTSLVVRALAGQSTAQPTFAVQNSTPTTLFAFFSNGTGGVGGLVSGSSFYVNNNNASVGTVGLTIKGVSGQTGDLQRWTSSTPTTLANVDSTGAIRSTSAIGTAHVAGATPTGGSSGDIKVGTGKIWANDAGTWKSVAIA